MVSEYIAKDSSSLATQGHIADATRAAVTAGRTLSYPMVQLGSAKSTCPHEAPSEDSQVPLGRRAGMVRDTPHARASGRDQQPDTSCQSQSARLPICPKDDRRGLPHRRQARLPTTAPVRRRYPQSIARRRLSLLRNTERIPDVHRHRRGRLLLVPIDRRLIEVAKKVDQRATGRSARIKQFGDAGILVEVQPHDAGMSAEWEGWGTER